MGAGRSVLTRHKRRLFGLGGQKEEFGGLGVEVSSARVAGFGPDVRGDLSVGRRMYRWVLWVLDSVGRPKKAADVVARWDHAY